MRFLVRALASLASLAVVALALSLVLPHVYERLFPTGGSGQGAPRPADLARDVAAVNQALARVLAEAGVGADQLVETREAEIERDGVRFRPSALDVHLPRAVDRAAVESAVRREVESLPARPRVYFTEPDEVTWGIRVSLGKFPTHRVTLFPPLPEDPPFDPRAPPRVALVVAGVGDESRAVAALVLGDVPVSLAVRPGKPWSVRHARDAARASKEVLAEVDPAALVPGAVGRSVRDALAGVPFAAGVAVGRGGPALAADTIAEVVEVLAPRVLPLIGMDPASVVEVRTAARARGVPVEEPAAWIDPSEGAERATRAAVVGRNIAVRRGTAVAAFPATDAGIDALHRFVERARGYRWVFATELARAGAAPEAPALGRP